MLFWFLSFWSESQEERLQGLQFEMFQGRPEKHILQCVKDLKGRLSPSKHQVLSASLMNKQFAKLIFICFCFWRLFYFSYRVNSCW